MAWSNSRCRTGSEATRARTECTHRPARRPTTAETPRLSKCGVTRKVLEGLTRHRPARTANRILSLWTNRVCATGDTWPSRLPTALWICGSLLEQGFNEWLPKTEGRGNGVDGPGGVLIEPALRGLG